MVRRLTGIAAVTVAAVAIAVLVIGRPGNASATRLAKESGSASMVKFSQLSRTTAALQHTFIMAAYIGPIESPFNTVDLSGGIAPLTGRAALFAKLRPGVIPFEGMPTPFVIGPAATKGILNAIGSAMSSPAGSRFYVGIYAIQTGSGKTAALKLNAAAGKSMLTKLASHLSGDPKAAMTQLKLAIFP